MMESVRKAASPPQTGPSKQLLLVGGAVLLSVNLIWAFFNAQDSLGQDDYPLLAKRVQLDNPNDALLTFAPLHESLKSYLNASGVDHSVYFEYLPTGTSIKLNADQTQPAASLMKLPAVMDLYRASELGRLDLGTKVALREEWLSQDFGDLWKRGVGAEISLRDAARLALTESDNTAVRAVIANTDGKLKPEEQSIRALDVEGNLTEDGRVKLSAESFSSFLKCLYFSCFLDHEQSHQVLEYLSESKFHDGLPSGLPSDTVVAHKIGSAESRSDCGIVYAPKRQYILCMILETEDTAKANEIMSEVSRLTYRYVTQPQIK